MTSSIEHHSTRGSAARASRRDMVEQVVDQARQALGLAADVTDQLAALALGDRRRVERSDRGQDRRQRRAQVVRDGPQQGGLEVVGAAQGARLDDLAQQRVALDGGAEDRLERRHHALAQALDDVRRQAGRDEQGADVEGQRDPSLVAADGAQLDGRRRELEGVGEALGDRRQGVGEARAAQQQARHLGRQVGLLAALLGLAGAHAGALGQRAGHQRGDEEDAERDPVLALGDREAARRRDVEEVEGQRAGQRRGRAQPAAPDRGDEQHGDEVDDPQRDDRRDLGQRIDERGGRGHRQRGDDGADGRRATVQARRGPWPFVHGTSVVPGTLACVPSEGSSWFPLPRRVPARRGADGNGATTVHAPAPKPLSEAEIRSAVVDCGLYDAGERLGGRIELESALRKADACQDGFVWIGLHDPSPGVVEAVGRHFELHPLAVEDAVHAHQRAKLEVHGGDTLFVVLKTARYVDSEELIEIGEVMVFLGPRFVVTVRHGEGSPLHDVRLDLEAHPDLLGIGPSSVLYAIADRVVDDYLAVIDGIAVDVEEVEAEVFSGAGSNPAERIYRLKREVLEFRRAVTPLIAPMQRLASKQAGLPLDPRTGSTSATSTTTSCATPSASRASTSC